MSHLPTMPSDKETLLQGAWLPELQQVFANKDDQIKLLHQMGIAGILGTPNTPASRHAWWYRLINVLSESPTGITSLCQYAREMYPGNPIFAGQARAPHTGESAEPATLDFTLPTGIPPDRERAILHKMKALAASMNTPVSIKADVDALPPSPLVALVASTVAPAASPVAAHLIPDSMFDYDPLGAAPFNPLSIPPSAPPSAPLPTNFDPLSGATPFDPFSTPVTNTRPLPSVGEHGFTWLHVSDIHFGDLHKCTDYAKKNILDELIIDAKNTAVKLGPPDFIFVTGDIAFRADLDREYGKASGWLQALAKAVGCTPSQVLCVPGNHDINRREAVDGFTPRIIHQALRTEPAHFDEVMGDRKTMEILWSKFAAYATFAERLGTPGISPETPWWCQAVASPVKPLIVVGLNTAVASFDNNDGPDNLLLGQRQLQKAVRDHPRDTLLVVLMHHPPEWLIDKDELLTALSKRPHILLCGHIHQESAMQTKTLDGQQILRFNVGAAHAKGEFRAFGYTWGRLRGQSLHYYPRTWVKDSGKFTGDRNKYEAMDTHGAVPYPEHDLPQLLKNWMEGSPR